MTFRASERHSTKHAVGLVCSCTCVAVCFKKTFCRGARQLRIPTTPTCLERSTQCMCLTWHAAEAELSVLNYPHLCLDSNASLKGFRCGEQPVENNSCECQKGESRGSLTFQGHTHFWAHLSTL